MNRTRVVPRRLQWQGARRGKGSFPSQDVQHGQCSPLGTTLWAGLCSGAACRCVPWQANQDCGAQLPESTPRSAPEHRPARAWFILLGPLGVNVAFMSM